MKRLLGMGLLLALLLLGTSARAAFFSESLIYSGPPEYGEVYESGAGPTYVSGGVYGKDVEVQADWWNIGGRLSNTWDNAYQGWIYGFADFSKDFEVTAAGEAAIGFSWNGTLQAVGNSAYDHTGWALWADAEITDDTLGVNSDVYWYEEINAAGTLNPSESQLFTYSFDEADIGQIFTISLVLQTQISSPASPISFSGDDTLTFCSEFLNALSIDSLSGGIEAVDGPAPVPIPAALWLFGTGLAGLAWIKSKRRGKPETGDGPWAHQHRRGRDSDRFPSI